MRASTPKKVMRAGFLLFPAVILAAAPAVASSPRCDEPPTPACARVQVTWVGQPLAELERIEVKWADQERVKLEQVKLEWAVRERAKLEQIKLEWAELEWAELERLELELPELPDLKDIEMERWVVLEAHVAPILEASSRHLASLRRAPEIEKAREASRHVAWKVGERLARMKSDATHPLNPAIQALISIAKVPARGIAPLRQVFAAVAKAASHVLLALLA